MSKLPRNVLRLVVNDHPGVMSHVCGLFARRALNVEGVLCLPTKEPGLSDVWLLVNEQERLEQMVRWLLNLRDVRHVERGEADEQWLTRVRQSLTSET